MGENTKIEWADKTWSPWTGCQAVSPACDNCYAQALDTRFGKADRWGPHGVRTRTSAEYWARAFIWDRSAYLNGRRYRVFPSMCDPFDTHHSIQPEWRSEFWLTMRGTPNLDWLLLTKRPQNIPALLPADWGDGYRNVWLGTTVENQAEADRRIPHLLHVPAARRFLSCEPLLGPVNLCAVDINRGLRANVLVRHNDHPFGSPLTPSAAIHWVIVGGESGAGSRPTNPALVRHLREQCAVMNVPFFFKQWGDWLPGTRIDQGHDIFAEEYLYGRVGKTRAGPPARRHRAQRLPGRARMIAQLDMFATPPPVGRKSEAPSAKPPRTKEAKPTATPNPKRDQVAQIAYADPIPARPRPAEWRRLLDLIPNLDTHFMVSSNWTGVVTEVLNHEATGHKHLLATGQIADIHFPAKHPAHTVYLTADEARSLHVASPLIQHGRPGTHCVTFRIARDDEATTLTLKMPEGM